MHCHRNTDEAAVENMEKKDHSASYDDDNFLADNYPILKELLTRISSSPSLSSERLFNKDGYCDWGKGLQANKLKEQLLYQLPPQDFNPTKRNSIKDVNDNDDENYFETNEFHLFRSIVQETAVGLANTKLFDENEDNEMKCSSCCEAILPLESYKSVDRLPDSRWHSDCFKCCQCDGRLIGDIYFAHESNIYCGRHYGELLKNRCPSCDELIFSEKFTSAEGRDWHQEHFCCSTCDVPLNNKLYVVIGNQQQITCLDCYHANVAERCQSCNKPIEAGKQRVRYESCSWHANESCFSCVECEKDLLDKPFFKIEERIFCSSKICSKELADVLS